MYICIDESGDLGRYPPSDSPYFVIAGIVVSKQKELEKVIFRARKKLSDKRQRQLSEMKHTNTTPKERTSVLKILSQRNCEYFCYILKKNAGTQNTSQDIEKYYTDGILVLISNIVSKHPDEREISIHIDKGPSSNQHRLLESKIRDQLRQQSNPFPISIKLNFLNSQNSNEIQCADFIAGAVHYYFRNGKIENEQWLLIKDKLQSITEKSMRN